MLQAKGIEVLIDKNQLLEEVDITLAPGSVMAVVGPNGSGKTTLLKILNGESQPTKGHVTLNGKSIHDWPIEDLAKLMGVLPQQSVLSFPFCVHEVVGLGRYPHDTGVVCDESIVKKALKMVDASHLIDRVYTTLSGGEKQRVHLARVLTQIWNVDSEEKYLLLDEPTSALDLGHQHLILQCARTLARDGAAVLVILHDLNLAAQYADSVIMLDEGALVATGNVFDVLTSANIQKVFGVNVDVLKHPHTDRPLIVYHDNEPASVSYAKEEK